MEFQEPTESDKELVNFVVNHCDRWRDYRDTNYLTDWLEYERIQSDIFDHIFAVVPEFDLRVYQAPTGQDLQNLT